MWEWKIPNRISSWVEWRLGDRAESRTSHCRMNTDLSLFWLCGKFLHVAEVALCLLYQVFTSSWQLLIRVISHNHQFTLRCLCVLDTKQMWSLSFTALVLFIYPWFWSHRFSWPISPVRSIECVRFMLHPFSRVCEYGVPVDQLSIIKPFSEYINS